MADGRSPRVDMRGTSYSSVACSRLRTCDGSSGSNGGACSRSAARHRIFLRTLSTMAVTSIPASEPILASINHTGGSNAKRVVPPLDCPGAVQVRPGAGLPPVRVLEPHDVVLL